MLFSLHCHFVELGIMLLAHLRFTLILQIILDRCLYVQLVHLVRAHLHRTVVGLDFISLCSKTSDEQLSAHEAHSHEQNGLGSIELVIDGLVVSIIQSDSIGLRDKNVIIDVHHMKTGLELSDLLGREIVGNLYVMIGMQ